MAKNKVQKQEFIVLNKGQEKQKLGWQWWGIKPYSCSSTNHEIIILTPVSVHFHGADKYIPEIG